MKAFRTAGVVSGLMAFLAWSPAAHAAARVFISVSGADSGDCSNVAAPCRTFNFAIAAVDAGGEVIVLTSGSYAGATINKAVRINVPSGVVAFSASSIVVAAGATDSVVIRGVTLKALTPGSGNAIDFQSGKRLSVESCVIDSWNEGISVSSLDSPNVYVLDTIVRNGTRGINSFANSGSANVVVHNSRLEDNSSFGVFTGDNSTISAQETVTAGGVTGFAAFGTGALNCQGCLATGHGNSGFVAISNTSQMRVSHSMVTKNGVGFNNDAAATFESLGNNLVAGNTTDTSGTITIIAAK